MTSSVYLVTALNEFLCQQAYSVPPLGSAGLAGGREGMGSQSTRLWGLSALTLMTSS